MLFAGAVDFLCATTILHINCGSMINKLYGLESILNEMPVTILALTETWLPPEAVDSFHIPGYNFIHKFRGVAYVHKEKYKIFNSNKCKCI